MRLGGKLVETIAKGEDVLFVVNRHPAGLISIYFFSVFGMALSFIVVNSLSNNIDISILDLSDTVWGAVLILLFVIIIAVTVVARQIYWANELIVTDENIIQILRRSLLSQDVAQLNLGKVQDVTVVQRGFWQFGFKYGTIHIETAGETANYKFRYAAQPNILAAKIIKAHDDYLENHGITQGTRMGSP